MSNSDTAALFIPDVVVDAADYDRLEQECEQWHQLCAEAQVQRDAYQAERDALQAQVEAMRAALNAVMTMDVNGHHLQDRLQLSTKGREILEKVNAALQATP